MTGRLVTALSTQSELEELDGSEETEPEEIQIDPPTEDDYEYIKQISNGAYGWALKLFTSSHSTQVPLTSLFAWICVVYIEICCWCTSKDLCLAMKIQHTLIETVLECNNRLLQGILSTWKLVEHVT